MSDVLISRDKAVETLKAIAGQLRSGGNLVGACLMDTVVYRIGSMEGIESWIPVSALEPPEGHWVLGWRDGDWDKTRIFDRDLDGEAFWSGHVFAKAPPTHWMELPEEPEEV